jgi:hypothetical protein
VVAQIEGQGDEEGASLSLDVQGVCSNFRHCFFTILDNILAVVESAGGEE